MIATNYSTLRKDLKHYLDRVCDDYETLVVTRKDDRNVVLVSQAEWESLQETLYLMSSRASREELDRSIGQLESGRGKRRELDRE